MIQVGSSATRKKVYRLLIEKLNENQILECINTHFSLMIFATMIGSRKSMDALRQTQATLQSLQHSITEAVVHKNGPIGLIFPGELVTRQQFLDADFNSRQRAKQQLLEEMVSSVTPYDSFFCAVILLNMAYMGYTVHAFKTRASDGTLRADLPDEWEYTVHILMELFFIFIFTIEFTMRLYNVWNFDIMDLHTKMGFEHIRGITRILEADLLSVDSINSRFVQWCSAVSARVRKHSFLILDFVVIVVSVGDLLLTSGIIDIGDQKLGVAALRFFRILRVVRFLKMFRYVKELYMLLNAFFNAFRTLIWVI